MLRLKDLKCRQLVQPLGIEGIPYFSWILESDEENVMQRSYHLQVRDNENRIVWDSARQTSEQSTYVEYRGCLLYTSTGRTRK